MNDQNKHPGDKLPENPASPRSTPGGGPFSERSALRWIGFGLEFVGVLAFFTWIGYMVDKHFETFPWLMVTGMLIAFVGMTYLLWKETRDMRQ